MFAVLAIILCCAVIPVVVGTVAFLGRSKKDKKPATREAAINQPEKD